MFFCNARLPCNVDFFLKNYYSDDLHFSPFFCTYCLSFSLKFFMVLFPAGFLLILLFLTILDLYRLQHPNIVQLMETYEDREHVYLIIEL